ncbi:MAG: Asp-tRNA(Asn)/Glu-tRNA(Gln) amidotransferase subunit GatC [Eubacteriales bacterium]
MKITKEEVKRIAVLSRLKLNEDEETRIAKNLENILAHAKKIDDLDTKDVPPTAHVLNVKNVFREDLEEKGLSIDKVLLNAPESGYGCFIVPKVLE